MAFVHLHTRSHYSLLSGLAKVDELVAATADAGMPAIALTDTANVYGAVELTVAAKNAGITPIIGCELRVCDDMRAHSDHATHSIVLLAMNDTGYHNLLALITAAQLDGFYREPRVDKDCLARHADGLIALSGWRDGEVPARLVDRDMDGARAAAIAYRDIFGAENFYLEVQPHDTAAQRLINDGCRDISAATGIPLVATSSIYYLRPADADAQDIATCIATGHRVDDTDRDSLVDFDLSFRTEAQMRAAFRDLPEALENTVRIAQRCTFAMTLGEIQLPHYELPPDQTADDALRAQCEEALAVRYGNAVTDEHRERMNYELGIIKKTGYASYFLIVQDFVNWARRNGIVVGPGRGSAAGSLVAYLTGITNIDPIGYKLLFERFLNPERVSMPDVDMDFADTRRDEVLHYVREKYGHDHVAQIITFGTMAARAAIRDVGRVLGYSYGYCDKLSKMIPMFTSIKEALEVSPEFAAAYEDPQARKLIDSAQRLEGIARHTSVHACGVVITKEPVTHYTPLQRVAGDDEAVVTQYASSTKFSSVEKIGLLKMDFLGLKNLTIIENTIRIVHKVRGGAKIDIDRIPLDDRATYELFQKGQTTGVFQFESAGMKRYLKQLKPTELEDIIAMVALYRPGPMEWIPDYIAGKHGTKKITYLHPKLEPILADTYGVAIYQEQVMRIAQDLAGFTLGEADILRKAMGKKIVELIQEQKVKFVDGAVANGVAKDVAEKVFAFIEPFAGYGFNRSHAACYALIGYQTAYLKAHYPAAFMAALMTSDQAHVDRIAIDVAECRALDITVLPPDINESFTDFAVVPGADAAAPSQGEKIRFGLNAIKGVGRDIAQTIVTERKKSGAYRDFTDFISRLSTYDDGKMVNKKSLEALAMVGAFDAFAERAQILHNIPRILAFAKELVRGRASAQTSLFGDNLFGDAQLHLTATDPADMRTRLSWEKALLGLYISDHPARTFRDHIAHIATPIGDLAAAAPADATNSDEETAPHHSIAGIVVAQQKILTKKGQQMLFVTLEDTTGAIECLVFPKTYEATRDLWEDEAALLIRGTLSTKDGECKLLVDDVTPLSDARITEEIRIKKTQAVQAARNSAQPLVITLPSDADAAQITALRDALAACAPGITPVAIIHNGIRMRTPFRITVDDAARAAIRHAAPDATIDSQ